MVVLATTEVMRIMGVWVRRADAGLAIGAVRNAASGVALDRNRTLEDSHALRDLDTALRRRTVPPPRQTRPDPRPARRAG